MVMYGVKLAWILREEQRLGMIQNIMPRSTFRPKRNEVTGGLGKVHNDELRDLYSSPSIIGIIKSRSMRWAGHVA
jgi:hypothetical protein